MKHNFTPLNDENESLAFIELMFGNYLLEKTLERFHTQPTPTSSNMQLGLLPCPTDGNETCTVYFSNSSSSSRHSSSSSTSTPNGLCIDESWATSPDESETHDGSRTKCTSVIQNNKQYMILSYVKFEGTNNDVEYESLILNTQRTNTMNEQSNLGSHLDLTMANLSTSYTLQQQQIVDSFIK